MKIDNKLQMDLLNSESLEQITGGKNWDCTKTGDTIYCNILAGDSILCATVEMSCNGGKFTFACGFGDVSCEPKFTSKPIDKVEIFYQ